MLREKVQKPKSAPEAIAGEKLLEGLSRRERIMLRITNRLGLSKELDERIESSVSADFDGIASKMQVAIDQGNEKNGKKNTDAECLIPWSSDGEEGSPDTTLAVQYRKLEGGGEAIAINASAFSAEGDGTTVVTRNEEGELGVDVNNSGEVVPLSKLSPVERMMLMPVLNAINQDVDRVGLTTPDIDSSHGWDD